MPSNTTVLPDRLLTPRVQAFLSQFRTQALRRVGSDRESIRQYAEMMRLDPVSRICAEVVMLGVLLSMGEYTHKRRRIEKLVRESIAHCRGSWRKTIRSLMRYRWYGESFAELAFEDMPTGKKTLSEVRVLKPGIYNYEGKNGEIEKVVYFGLEQKELDYKAGIHLVNADELTGDEVYGSGCCESAYPFWQLHEVLMPVLAIAAQRQATPILVKKTETGADVVLIDQETGTAVLDPATNQPMLIKKGWDSLRQLEQLGLAGVTVIDPDDDLFAVEMSVQGDFLLELLKTCEMYRMTAFLVPATTFSFSNSGLGDAGLAESHREIFEQMIASIIEDLSESLVESIFRPMIEFNFGPQDDYGYFPAVTAERNTEKLAEILINAIKNKVFSKADIDAINRLRSFLGLESLDEDELSELWAAESLLTPTSAMNDEGVQAEDQSDPQTAS